LIKLFLVFILCLQGTLANGESKKIIVRRSEQTTENFPDFFSVTCSI